MARLQRPNTSGIKGTKSDSSLRASTGTRGSQVLQSIISLARYLIPWQGNSGGLRRLLQEGRTATGYPASASDRRSSNHFVTDWLSESPIHRPWDSMLGNNATRLTDRAVGDSTTALAQSRTRRGLKPRTPASPNCKARSRSTTVQTTCTVTAVEGTQTAQRAAVSTTSPRP